MDMKRNVYIRLQIYILVITLMCYKQTFCRTEKPIKGLYSKFCIAKVSQAHQLSPRFFAAAITLNSICR